MAGEPSHDLGDPAPTGVPSEITRLIVISAFVALIFAGGVYWLRHLPARSPGQEPSSTIQVRLLQSPESASLPMPAEEVVNDKHRDGRSQQQKPETTEEDLQHEEIPLIPSTLMTIVPPSQTVSVPSQARSERRFAPPELTSKFQRALQRHIARFQKYPARARAGGLEGTVQVLFLLERDGSVLDVWVQSSSGQKILDDEAIETLRRAEPLPTIPSELPGQLRVLLPIAFALP